MANENSISIAIPLKGKHSKGLAAIIDKQDESLTLGIILILDSRGYVRLPGRGIMLHRVVMGCNGSEIVDHINGDKLDNRRRNLRICSHSENMRNRRSVSGKCKYKGVTIEPLKTGGMSFRAQMTFNRKCIKLGTFPTAEAAAAAYDEAAIRLHGKFACTNRHLGLL